MPIDDVPRMSNSYNSVGFARGIMQGRQRVDEIGRQIVDFLNEFSELTINDSRTHRAIVGDYCLLNPLALDENDQSYDSDHEWGKLGYFSETDCDFSLYLPHAGGGSGCVRIALAYDTEEMLLSVDGKKEEKSLPFRKLSIQEAASAISECLASPKSPELYYVGSALSALLHSEAGDEAIINMTHPSPENLRR